MGQGCTEAIRSVRHLCTYAIGVMTLLWVGGCGGVFTEIPELDTEDGRVFAQRCGACHGKAGGRSLFLKTMVPSTSGCIVSWRRRSNLPTLTLDRLRALLREYVDQTGQVVDLVLIGGMAMLAYGHPSRATIDVDGELRNGVRSLKAFLSRHNIPANLWERLSGWSENLPWPACQI